MKQPHVWIVEIWEDKKWKPRGLIPWLRRQDAAEDAKWWRERVGNKYRPAKYVREKP